MKIDLNCDLGESFGRYSLGSDAALMAHITSANIACGFHAGDPSVMQATVRLAHQYGVSIGAHPGWPDLQGFGRRRMSIAPDEAGAMVLYQLGALAAFARAEGTPLRHVKPHGELYNQAAQDRTLALAIARAVRSFSTELILVGLAGSQLVAAGQELGLSVASEAFPDRAYNPDGTLLSRSLPGALIDDPHQVAAHALQLATQGILFGGETVRVDTLCLHGDQPDAVQNAILVHQTLRTAGVEVGSL
jgi:UPF0271 protein